jgi:hypothetical protein
VSALTELQHYTFTSKYARYNPELQRRETWIEAVNRVRGMMLEKYKDKTVDTDINFAYDLMLDKKVLGSQRALQFGGKPVFDHNARSYNCSGTYCDRLRVFQEIFYVLLCGSGVGYSVSKCHINKLPTLSQKTESTKVISYTVPDSIEGWADSVGVLLSHYFDNPIFQEYSRENCSRLIFDYSLIRPKGAYLSSSSGKAPGPEPLKNIHNNIRTILDRVIILGLTKLRTIDIHDIVCHIADGVLSGGVRRSSCICLFDFDDVDMLECKSGNWFKDNPQRARANNSVLLNRNKTTFEQFHKLFTNIRTNGEPGFLFTDNEYFVLTNPCLPAFATVQTQGCNTIKIDDLNVGDKIWDGTAYVTVLNKQSSGPQEVYDYSIKNGDKTLHFYCTEDHRIICNKQKIPIKDATHIEYLDFFPIDLPIVSSELHSYQEVFDITVDNLSHTFWCNGFNVANCGEIGLYAYNSKQESGFQFCNLTSINCGKIESEEDFYNCCKAAAIIGTLQAGFASFPYLGKITEEITQKEALLGVSLAGMMEKENIVLDGKIQQKAAKLILKTNEELAKKIGINAAARSTAEKPDGQTGTLLGISSGIHPHHSKRYLRRVQANHAEKPFQLFKEYNPQACEQSVWSANNTDDVISFPVEVPDGVKTKNQLPALQMLENVRSTQNNWIKYGKRADLCVQDWLSHAVSNTVVVKENEWEDVEKYVYEHRKDFAGITFLPMSGDKDYPQAPFCAVYTSREIVREYGDAALWCSGLIESAIKAFPSLWAACNTALNDNFNEELLKTEEKHTSKKYKSMYEQVEVWKNIRKYAAKYFNGDVKKLTYCLKDVYNWKLWNDLQSTFKKVPYEKLKEDSDNTKLEEVIACSGGACTGA